MAAAQSESKTTRVKPAYSTKIGRVHGAVWHNNGKDGEFYSTQVYRIFRDENDKFVKTMSFSPGDLANVAAVAEACSTWVTATLDREREAERERERERADAARRLPVVVEVYQLPTIPDLRELFERSWEDYEADHDYY